VAYILFVVVVLIRAQRYESSGKRSREGATDPRSASRVEGGRVDWSHEGATDPGSACQVMGGRVDWSQQARGRTTVVLTADSWTDGAFVLIDRSRSKSGILLVCEEGIEPRLLQNSFMLQNYFTIAWRNL